ncbi:MAG: hypothetical protein ACK5LO_00830 [Leucobacter sp.]
MTTNAANGPTSSPSKKEPSIVDYGDLGRGEASRDTLPPDSEEAPTDVAEKPGSTEVSHDHADELADEWGEESFPGSDPPAHY